MKVPIRTYAFIDASNLFYGGEKTLGWSNDLTNAKLTLFDRHIKQVRFYKNLEEFGYKLVLKPVKIYWDEKGDQKRKANCDRELTYKTANGTVLGCRSCLILTSIHKTFFLSKKPRKEQFRGCGLRMIGRHVRLN